MRPTIAITDIESDLDRYSIRICVNFFFLCPYKAYNFYRNYTIRLGRYRYPLSFQYMGMYRREGSVTCPPTTVIVFIVDFCGSVGDNNPSDGSYFNWELVLICVFIFADIRLLSGTQGMKAILTSLFYLNCSP